MTSNIKGSNAKRLQNLRERILHITQEVLADKLGKSVNTISNWENGHTKLTDKKLRHILRLYDIDEVKFFENQEDMFKNGGEKGAKGGKYTEGPKVPKIGPRLEEVRIWEWAGAGQAYDLRENDFEMESAPLRVMQLPEEVVNAWRDAFETRGDSMTATLNDGDVAGIDFNDKTFVSGHLFAIYSAYEGYTIKRLESNSPYGIMVKSDNPTHGDYLIPHDKLEHDLRIIGRVAWIFGTRKKHKK